MTSGELQLVFSGHKSTLADRRSTFLNAHGKRFKNLGSLAFGGVDTVIPVGPAIPNDKYFVLDDHLDIEGHRFLGLKLAVRIH